MNKTSIFPSYIFDKETGWRADMPDYIEPGTRVLCLYRVSSNKQLYHTDDNEPDIPMQRVRCREYCEQMGWTLVCEVQEEGISGHKIRAESRDKVQLIKEYAKKKKFDILLVFMFDRIGRISDETPFVVEWLIANGIRVWSALEGEQKIENHTDRLTNYIYYWQADGESQKISARTSNSLGVLTEAGCFTGGLCAYGYRYVKLGRTNRRKQEVYDLEICEEEAYVVRLIFRLAANEGYGAQRIANYLNAKGMKNRKGENWHPATIQGILRNVLYTGILRSGKSRSQVIERLRIIDERTFEAVRDMLRARSRENQVQRSAPLNTRAKSLLSGNVFCGHCGARLCITTSGKGRPRADGTDVKRMRYTCQTKSRKHGDCDGQTGYTVEKLDGIVDTVIQSIFARVRRFTMSEVMDLCYRNELASQKVHMKKLKKDYEKAKNDLQKLKDEIVKALLGESAFSPEVLNDVIHQQEEKCEELRSALQSSEQSYFDNAAQIAEIERQYNDMIAWSEAYDLATMSAKKVIVSHIVDRVDVFRDYKLRLTLHISVQQFLGSLEIIDTARTPQTGAYNDAPACMGE